MFIFHFLPYNMPRLAECFVHLVAVFALFFSARTFKLAFLCFFFVFVENWRKRKGKGTRKTIFLSQCRLTRMLHTNRVFEWKISEQTHVSIIKFFDSLLAGLFAI